MKNLAALLLCTLLAACASRPPMPPPATLFHDELFEAPSERIDPSVALAVSPAMRQYLATRPVARAQLGDRRRLLIDALYRGDLKLEYLPPDPDDED